MFASLSPEQCSVFHDRVIELDNYFQKGLEQVPLDLKPQPLEPFSEIFTFSETIYSMLNCSVTNCTVNACHGAMLRLGKYKHGLDDYDSWHLCVLLAPPSSRQHWCETAMYRAKVGRCVEMISWYRNTDTDAKKALRPKCPSHKLKGHRAKPSNTDRAPLVNGDANFPENSTACAICSRLTPTQKDRGA
jgi:hypothetical protein